MHGVADRGLDGPGWQACEVAASSGAGQGLGCCQTSPCMALMFMRGAWLVITANALLDSVKAIHFGPEHSLVNILPHFLPGFLHIFKLRCKKEVWQTASQTMSRLLNGLTGVVQILAALLIDVM